MHFDVRCVKHGSWTTEGFDLPVACSLRLALSEIPTRVAAVESKV